MKKRVKQILPCTRNPERKKLILKIKKQKKKHKCAFKISLMLIVE